MQIVDVVIILMLALGAVVGFARGFLKQTVQSLGGILVIILAFIFTNPVADFLIEVFPTFNVGGIFSGISSLSILIYKVIAFTILLIILSIILRILLSVASFIENLLKATIILAIPSKILGAIMGFVEAYVIIFIILFILTLPVFNIGLINQSKYKDKILDQTPVISALASKTVKAFDQVYAIRDELAAGADKLQMDRKILKILIDNGVISEKRATDLYEKGKLNTK